MSVRIIRRQIPLAVTFAIGVIITGDWFIKWGPLQTTTNTLMNFQIIITAFMMGFAGINLIVLHQIRIRRNVRDKKLLEAFFSILLLACLFVWTAVGVIFGETSPTYQWLYNNFNLPLSATAYAMSLFFLASAVYRVLRVRSGETTVLLIVASVTLLGNMPLMQGIFPFLIPIKDWIANILVKSTYRAITIGMGLGGIMMGVRTLLAMETGYLGATEE